jgi:hypothetical protein
LLESDLIVVGAGAAGLMAAIAAGRARPGLRIAVVDGAAKLGAKILVSGGGRCNVTHDRVDERAFCGSTPGAIRSVLRRFDVARTIDFFRDLGVALKREETGKLFPTTDSARTVLDALLGAAQGAGVRLVHPFRVAEIRRQDGAFVAAGPAGAISAARVVLATGGRSLPKSGSDGHGYAIARSLGHSLTPRIFPALVPLLLPADHPLCALRGVAVPVAVQVRDGRGRKLVEMDGPLLCTHFGLSGPAILDVSRHWIDAAADDAAAQLLVTWLPGERFETADAMLLGLPAAPPRALATHLAARLPERLARTICAVAGADAAAPPSALTRDARRALARALTEMAIPVTGDRGFAHAEVTAGGVPLREIDLATMESRVCPGLHVVGEICDVDGRIGGYNFQWAWASGHVAGRATAGAPEGVTRPSAR